MPVEASKQTQTSGTVALLQARDLRLLAALRDHDMADRTLADWSTQTANQLRENGITQADYDYLLGLERRCWRVVQEALEAARC